MYSINKIQDMLNDEQILTLGQLDDVAIRGVNAIAARISLGLEMYIPPRDTHVLYPQMAVLFEDYYSRFSSKLNYYGSPPSGRILKITSKFLTTMRNKLENFNYNTQYNPYIFFDDQYHGELFNASPWNGLFWGRPAEDNKLSAVWATMSLRDDNGKLHIDSLLEMAFQWCNQIQPAHGNAGLYFCPTIGRSGASYYYALMQRHPGIDYINRIDLIHATQGCFNRVKGVNWLTILNDEIVEELGGLEYCKKQIEPECYIEKWKGGIIIIAGPLPQCGDTYNNFIPERYKKVAKLIRPVRVNDYRGRKFLKLDAPFDNETELNKWLKRFD
ncbi:DUF3396 domain-containing protein [Escherichia coli]|uniref:type VI immunity family protein n=1 Tax=Escherichia sp. MOD1-EC7003 TaxID=2093900 RepID=UPI000CF7613E|nr:type VI immunity family protein [Escherichia sp. MOD1-EC7003]EGO8362118.1 DUF3396 domain-containing protein [Escherichia coli]EGO8379616.1 DUF3396 domain-containing protein [Escherichia coli]MCH0695913.1 DUF3396 domain-containing protein [Escherichia coli]